MTTATRALLVACALAGAGCKSRREAARQDTVPVEAPRDGGPADGGAPSDASAWTDLAELPLTTPLREVILPSRADVPRFDVGGPVVWNEIAVVGSSQLGFAAIDWRRGALVWTKPAGTRLAPPAVRGGSFVLIGDCLSPPEVPAHELLLGCMRSVTPAGADEAYLAIHGTEAAVDAFSHAAGTQDVWATGDRIRWRRGELAISIDPISGVAQPAPVEPPALAVDYKGRHWDITHADGKIVAHAKGKDAWQTEHAYGALLGIVWLPDQAPMVRVATITGRYGSPEVRLLDMDATGSMNGQAAWTPVPGIAVLAHAISPVGDAALVVRLDKTLRHDYLAGYAANALLRWVWPLPDAIRVDPIGVALGLDDQRAPEAVVVFHDGDVVTILPELSSPPTAPGAVRGPSENSTP